MIKFSEEPFIYPYTHEEEKEMIHNTRIQLAYDEGVDAGVKAGIEQNKLEVIKNMLSLKLPISTIAKSLNIDESNVEKIIKENNLEK